MIVTIFGKTNPPSSHKQHLSMDLPFTTEQFFNVFAQYNHAVWPMQVVLFLLAVAVVFLLLRPIAAANRLISTMLALFWAWMAIAYHFAFFTAINPAAWLFGGLFLVAALVFIWLGVVKDKLRFAARSGVWGWLGGLLIVYALIIYPLLGWWLGHRYPELPTFGLPCPTTIFTLGILLCTKPPVPRSVFIVPLLWSAIGAIAAWQLNVLQDYGLLLAGIIALSFILLPTDRSKKI